MNAGIQWCSRNFRFIKGLHGRRRKRTHRSDPASPRVTESHPPLNDEDDEDPRSTDHCPDSPITDYRLPITDHFPFASTASAVFLPLHVPLFLLNHISEPGSWGFSISRVSPGCLPSLGFRLGP